MRYILSAGRPLLPSNSNLHSHRHLLRTNHFGSFIVIHANVQDAAVDVGIAAQAFQVFIPAGFFSFAFLVFRHDVGLPITSLDPGVAMLVHSFDAFQLVALSVMHQTSALAPFSSTCMCFCL